MKDSSHGSAFSESGTPGAPCNFSTSVYTCSPADQRLRPRRRPAGAPPPSTGAVRRRAARAAAVRARRTGIVRAGAVPATVPVWNNRAGWVTAVTVWAAIPERFTDACAAAGESISPATVVAVARVMADAADGATGRHSALARATIAARIGAAPRTVTRAWAVLRAAGHVVEAARGHGGPGRPAYANRPSVYALVSAPPRPAAVDSGHLPPTRRVGGESHVGNRSPSGRGDATATENLRLTAPQRRRGRYRATPRPLALQRLAAALVCPTGPGRPARLHGLDRGHIGAVCDALTNAKIDPAVWSARDIKAALDDDMRTRGWSWPDRVDRPGGFLAARLRRLPTRPVPPVQTRVGVAATSPDTEPAAVPADPATVRRSMAAIRAVLAARRSGTHNHGTGAR